MIANTIKLLAICALIPLVAADCNIDSAGLKTYSTSDGLVITRVGVVATFRLGCAPGTKAPKLHAENDEGQYLAVSSSSQKPEFKSVSFVEDLAKSKSRWIEIKVYDDDTYQKLTQARLSGSSVSSYQPMKSISVSHSGVTGGPFIKMETIATLGLIVAFAVAHSFRSKIVS